MSDSTHGPPASVFTPQVPAPHSISHKQTGYTPTLVFCLLHRAEKVLLQGACRHWSGLVFSM